MNNARRSDYFCVVENDWKTNSNFINEINKLHKDPDYSSNSINDNSNNQSRIMKNISIRGQSIPKTHPSSKIDFRKIMNTRQNASVQSNTSNAFYQHRESAEPRRNIFKNDILESRPNKFYSESQK